jgi:hypothetical protein
MQLGLIELMVVKRKLLKSDFQKSYETNHTHVTHLGDDDYFDN